MGLRSETHSPGFAMKNVLRIISTAHGLMAFLFACAALALIVIATRVGWTALAGGLDRAAAQGVIDAGVVPLYKPFGAVVLTRVISDALSHNR